jgi:hypothetical protein
MSGLPLSLICGGKVQFTGPHGAEEPLRRGGSGLKGPRRRIDDAFAAGFTRVPEGDAELRDAMRLAIEAIEEEPWEPW